MAKSGRTHDAGLQEIGAETPTVPLVEPTYPATQTELTRSEHSQRGQTFKSPPIDYSSDSRSEPLFRSTLYIVFCIFCVLAEPATSIDTFERDADRSSDKAVIPVFGLQEGIDEDAYFNSNGFDAVGFRLGIGK